MVEKMKQQQADLMRENHFLFEKVESHPLLRRYDRFYTTKLYLRGFRSNTIIEFVRRLSQTSISGIKAELPVRSQIVKQGYLTKQGGLIKNWYAYSI